MNSNGTGPATDWYTVETYDNDLDETQVRLRFCFVLKVDILLYFKSVIL